MKNKFTAFILIILFLTFACPAFGAADKNSQNKDDAGHVMPIALATDNNYVYPTLIAMASIMEKKHSDTHVNFHVMISGSLSSENKTRMANFQNFYKNCSVELIDMKDKFSDAYLCGHDYVTTPAFYRLALPSLLPQYDKILYLDGDILVRKDLWNMFCTDISDSYIGGVRDYGWEVWTRSENYAQKLGTTDMNQYINSGILLINSKKIREDNLEKAFSEYALTLKNRKLKLPDQDLLNAVCYNKIKLLSPEYNAMQHYGFSYGSMDILVNCYDAFEFKKACTDPTIVHFAGSSKPWTTYRWRFYEEWNNIRKIAEEKFYKILNEGVYILSSAINNNKVLDIPGAKKENGLNLQLWESNSTNAQKFKLNYVGEGYYEIETTCSGKVLDVEALGKKAGTRVIQYTRNNGNNQKWMIKDAGGGYYYLVSKCNGLCLDVAASETANGTKIQVWDPNNTNAQKFKFKN